MKEKKDKKKFPNRKKNKSVPGKGTLQKNNIINNTEKSIKKPAVNPKKIKQIRINTDALLKAQFEHSPDLIMVLDRKFRFLSLNKIIFTSNTIKELIGKDAVEQLPVKTRELVRENLIKCFESGSIMEFEHEVGGNKWAFARIVPLPEGKKINRVMVISTDITKRKNAEDTIRKSEEKYRMLFNSNNDAIFINEYNDDGTPGNFTEVNDVACSRFGYSRDEFLKMSPYELDAPEMAPHINHVTSTLRSSGRHIFDTLHVTKSGRKIPTEISSHFFLIDGKPAALSVARDISERKRIEEVIAENEAKFTTLFQSIPLSIALTSLKDKKIVDVNPVWLKSNEFNFKEEVIGRTVAELGIIREYQEYMPVLDDINKSCSIHNVEVICHTRTGRKRILLSNFDKIKIGGNDLILTTCEDITNRKAAEVALKESEERYRSIVENINDSLYIYDFNGKILDVNENTCKMLGYSREELIGSNLAMIDSRENTEKVPERSKQLLTNHWILFEGVHIRKDGSPVPVEVSGKVISSDGNGIIQGFTRDITKRKKSEKELSESNRLLSLYISQSPVYAYIKSVTCEESRVIYASDNFENMIGLPGSEMTGKSMRDLYSPDFADKITADDWDVASKGHILNIDESLNGRDYLTIKFPIKQESRTLIAGYTIDITDRKRAEASLQASEERFRRLVESVSDYIYTVSFESENKYLTNYGPACISVTGYSQEEFNADPELWLKIVYNDDRKYLTGQIDKIVNGEDIPPIEHRIVHKNGSVRWIRNIPVLRKNTLGKVTAYDGLISDITEYVHAQNEKERLESLLRQSQKMEAVGTFVGGIAHDFNNIISILLGYSNLMRMEIEPDNPMYTYVEQILSSSEKAANLIKSLLMFSRKQPAARKPVNLNNIIANIEKLLERLLTEDIALEIKYHEKDIIIKADPSHIDQILLNLATNARDAMPNGGKIYISLKTVDFNDEFAQILGYGQPGRKYALITFSDNGAGMDPGIAEQIFDPFFTTKEVGKGTGLGMSTVYGLVQQHEGHINIYSEKGSGTAFNIFFPLTVEESPERAQNKPLMESGNETILIAEDNDNVRLFMKTVLTKYGYIVIEAADGEDAVNKFKMHRNIDLAVIDSVMPKKNGREVYDEIIKINPGIKTLFCSGYTRDIVLNKGIEEMEFNFLAKPLTPDIFLEKVREILDKR